MSSASRSRAVPSCLGPASRREFLRAGVLGMSGLTLTDFFRRQAFAEADQDIADLAAYYASQKGLSVKR